MHKKQVNIPLIWCKIILREEESKILNSKSFSNIFLIKFQESYSTCVKDPEENQWTRKMQNSEGKLTYFVIKPPVSILKISLRFLDQFSHFHSSIFVYYYIFDILCFGKSGALMSSNIAHDHTIFIFNIKQS